MFFSVIQYEYIFQAIESLQDLLVTLLEAVSNVCIYYTGKGGCFTVNNFIFCYFCHKFLKYFSLRDIFDTAFK